MTPTNGNNLIPSAYDRIRLVMDASGGLQEHEIDAGLEALEHLIHLVQMLEPLIKQRVRERDEARARLSEIRSEVESTPWKSTPVEAHVYRDDERWCIHLWKNGLSHDIFVPLDRPEVAP